jgi:hypothetical protein
MEKSINEINLGYKYTYEINNGPLFIYKEHGVYVSCTIEKNNYFNTFSEVKKFVKETYGIVVK